MVRLEKLGKDQPRFCSRTLAYWETRATCKRLLGKQQRPWLDEGEIALAPISCQADLRAIFGATGLTSSNEDQTKPLWSSDDQASGRGRTLHEDWDPLYSEQDDPDWVEDTDDDDDATDEDEDNSPSVFAGKRRARHEEAHRRSARQVNACIPYASQPEQRLLDAYFKKMFGIPRGSSLRLLTTRMISDGQDAFREAHSAFNMVMSKVASEARRAQANDSNADSNTDGASGPKRRRGRSSDSRPPLKRKRDEW